MKNFKFSWLHGLILLLALITGHLRAAVELTDDTTTGIQTATSPGYRYQVTAAGTFGTGGSGPAKIYAFNWQPAAQEWVQVPGWELTDSIRQKALTCTGDKLQFQVFSPDNTTALSIEALRLPLTSGSGESATVDAESVTAAIAEDPAAVRAAAGAAPIASPSFTGLVTTGAEGFVSATVDGSAVYKWDRIRNGDEELDFMLPNDSGTLALTSDINTANIVTGIAGDPAGVRGAAGAVGLTGNETVAGNKTLSGQLELTGQSATNTTSAITRSIGDSRYTHTVRSFTTTDGTAIQSQTALQDTGCTVTLEPGTWHIKARVVTTNANGAAQAKFGGVITGGTFTELYGGLLVGTGNSVATSDIGASIFTTTRNYNASTSRTFIEYDFMVIVTAGNPVLKTQYAQNVSTAADTVRKAGSYIIAIKVIP